MKPKRRSKRRSKRRLKRIPKRIPKRKQSPKKKINPKAKSWYPKSANYVLSAHGGYSAKFKFKIPSNVKIIFYAKKGSELDINNVIQTRICENPNKTSYTLSQGYSVKIHDNISNRKMTDYYFTSDRVYFTFKGQTTDEILEAMKMTLLNFLGFNPQYIGKITRQTKWKANIRLNKVYPKPFYTIKKRIKLVNFLGMVGLTVVDFLHLNPHWSKKLYMVDKSKVYIPKGVKLKVTKKKLFYSGLVKCSNNRVLYNIDTMGPIWLSQLIDRIWKPNQMFIIHAVVCRTKIN